MNPAQALARWISGVNTGEEALADKRDKLASHMANPPTSADPADHRNWLAIKRDLEDDIAAEEAALRIAEDRKADAQRAADDAAIDAEAKDAERAAREAAKLTLEIGDDAPRLAAKLAKLEALRRSVDAYNEKRGARPHLTDGEARVREAPEKVIPAVYETVTVWEDGAGNRPYQFRQLLNGELVPSVNGYTARKEKVVSRAEQIIPAQIRGGRFADGFKLIGLKGEPLFPAL